MMKQMSAKARKELLKHYESLKLPHDIVREKIMKALKLEFMMPELIDVFSDTFTYTLINPLNKSESFHRVEYLIFSNEIVIDWESSKRIRPPKQ
jgi:hypothetical protein